MVVPWPVDVLDDAEDRLDQDGRESHGRLVEQQQARARHQRAADGQHLLLAARERAALLRDALAQPREEREARARGRRRSPSRSARAKAPSSRFSSTLMRGKMRRPSGDCAMPRRTMRSVGSVSIALAVEADGAAPRPHGAEDRAQRGGLARAVGADQRDDLAALARRARQPAQRADVAVVGVDVGELEHAVYRAVPRAASSCS